MCTCFFERRELLDASDARVRAMYAWHAIEEVEHKAVAFDVLTKVAKAGYLVRTFPDPTQAQGQAAVASGATVVSTDHPPGNPDKSGYTLQLPGGGPSRCNPLTAPAACTTAAVQGRP